jgi:DNA-binding transcriptional MerR regulator
MGTEAAKGASKSLNKTIKEITEYLGQKKKHLRRKPLRAFLREKLADLAEKRYRRGFRRGHMESHKKFAETGVVPNTLHYYGEREFFKDQKRKVHLTSKIKTKT